MKSRSLGLPITLMAALMTVAAACMWGTARVSGYSQADGGQQSDSSQRRRGKNGTPAPSSQKADPAATPSDQSSAQADQDSAAGSNGQQDRPASNASGQPAQPGSAGAKQPARSNSRDSTADPLGSRSGPQSSRSGPQPPPFDRPPIRSTTSPGADSSSGRNGHAGRSDRDQASQPAGNDSDSTGDGARGRTEKPELKRSPDLGPAPPAGNSDRGRPPVLRRRTDDQGETDSSQQSQQQPSRTQQAGQQSSGKDDTIKLDATLVNIPLVVSDRSGRFIPQLSKDDFDVYEDGVRQQIAFFGNDEVPFNVALMLDVSPSVSNSLQDIQEAAVAFVRQLRAEDRVMVVSFDQNVRFLTDFTNDRSVLQRAINNTRTGSGTSVYEAVYDTVANRLRHVEGRKALLLLSDGEDTTSRSVGYDQAINIVTESDVLVYGLRYPDTGTQTGPWRYPRNRMPFPIPDPRFPFPFPWPHFNFVDPTAGSSSSGGGGQWRRRSGRDSDRGRDFMADVTEAGGGPVYDAKTVHDMSRLARQIADELRHVYVVSYYPTNSLSSGGYRAIRVKVRGRDDIAVRHRRGYDAAEVRSKPTI